MSDTPPAPSPSEDTQSLDGNMPAAGAVAARLAEALQEIEARVPLVLADTDPEHLHKLRVAVRRSRVLLNVLGGVLPAKIAKRGKTGLRWLGCLSTPVRDLDVLLDSSTATFDEPLRDALRQRRRHDWAVMAEGLRGPRFARFCQKWHDDLATAGDRGPTLSQAVGTALLASAEAFIRDATALSATSPPDDLHALRKAGKQLRYLLAFGRELFPKAEVKPLLRQLKQAQEALGRYQDLTAHRALLQQFPEARPYLNSLECLEPARRAEALAALEPFRQADALSAYRRLLGSAGAKRQRTLILWRHGKSSWTDASSVDMARPLSDRGYRAARQMAGWIAAQDQPDRVICSPARRTVETWQYLAPLLQAASIRFDRTIYEAPPQHLLEALRRTPPSVECLLLIGHNPGLEDLTALLAQPLAQKFVTGGCAVLRFEGEWRDLSEGQAQLSSFRAPKRGSD